MIKIFFIFILLLLSACEQETETEQVEPKEIIETEEERIKNIQSIINDIRNFNIDELQKDFYTQEIKGKGPIRLVLLGENHTDFQGIKKNWGFINYIAKQESLILTEGASRKYEPNIAMSYVQILRIYLLKLWLPLKKSYQPEEFAEWIFSRTTTRLLNNMLDNNDLSGLNILKTKYGFWDSKKGLAEKEVDFESVSRRNRAMIKAIEQRMKESANKNIIVVAGLLHLPLGELLYNNWPPEKDLSIDIEKTYDEHYQKIALLHRKHPQISEYGSTEVIYQYFKNAKIGYFQAIPKTSFSNKLS